MLGFPAGRPPRPRARHGSACEAVRALIQMCVYPPLPLLSLCNACRYCLNAKIAELDNEEYPVCFGYDDDVTACASAEAGGECVTSTMCDRMPDLCGMRTKVAWALGVSIACLVLGSTWSERTDSCVLDLPRGRRRVLPAGVASVHAPMSVLHHRRAL